MSLLRQICGVYAWLVCESVFTVITSYQNEFSMQLILRLESPRMAGQEARDNRMLATAGKERKPARKAVDCGGTGIVIIVSVHIISSQLLYLAFRRKRKTACSGSPASLLS